MWDASVFFIVSEQQQRLLYQTYYNFKNGGAYSGFDKFWQSLENEGKTDALSKIGVKKWLNSQEAYSVHRPVIRHFKRRRVYVDSINQQFEADLFVLDKFVLVSGPMHDMVRLLLGFSRAWAAGSERCAVV